MKAAAGRLPLMFLQRTLPATFVLALAVAAAADHKNDQSAILTDGSGSTGPTVYHWIFGSDAVEARRQLGVYLCRKIAIVDRICQLTDIQMQRLRLAGAGENVRLIDRVDEIGQRYGLVKDDPDKVSELRKEVDLLLN